MSAIAVVYTKSGIVFAADGRSRWGDDSTRDDSTTIFESERQQKVFRGAVGTREVAWGVTGSIFNKDKSFNLIDLVNKTMSATNAFSQGCGPWVELFTSNLRKSILAVRDSGIQVPLVENSSPDPNRRFILATMIMAGYFCNGRSSAAIVDLSHEDGELLDPLPYRLIATNFTGEYLSGSEEIRLRYLDVHEDKRLRHHFHVKGPALDDGLAYATGYIKACSDDLAREIDPVVCGGIGGEIHAAAVKPSGFSWLIEPEDSVS